MAWQNCMVLDMIPAEEGVCIMYDTSSGTFIPNTAPDRCITETRHELTTLVDELAEKF